MTEIFMRVFSALEKVLEDRLSAAVRGVLPIP